MSDYNRNQQSSYKGSNQDWNENRGRNRDEDDRNFSSNENRGMGNSNYESSGWQSRYERDDNNRGGGYSTGRYGRHYDSDLQSGSYGNDRGYGYASYYGSDANSGWERMGSTNQGGSYGGGMGSSSYGNYGNRGLYDRDYQGMGRSEYANSGTRLGGGNYGSWGDQNRGYYEGRNDRNWGNRSGNQGQQDRNWFDRAGDEVASWFGDEEAERRRDRDKRMQGQHRGKGPKNYNRSDDRIKEDINDRLSDDPFVDASEIDVTVSNGEVTLTGTVDERSSKRRAEDIAENVSGVRNVENRIRVSSSSSTSYGSTSTGSTSTGSGAGSTSSGASDSSTTSQSTSGVAGSERTRNKSYVTG